MGCRAEEVIKGCCTAWVRCPTQTSGEVRFHAAVKGIADIKRALDPQRLNSFGNGR
jgi:hypothetical protein